jgi:hypothetical protein
LAGTQQADADRTSSGEPDRAEIIVNLLLTFVMLEAHEFEV